MVENNLKEYYDNPALSQSKLKLLINTPHLFGNIKEQDLYYEEKKHFYIGSAVDCIITQGEEVFKELYHISDVVNKPSENIMSILNQLFDKVLQETEINDLQPITDELYRPLILQCCESHDYGKTYKEGTKISKVCEGWEYWNDLIKSYGKQILSKDESDLINSIVLSLKSNEVTSKYFLPEKNVQILYQYYIGFEYGDIPCKALLDILIVDYNKKTLQPIDIKTIGDYTINFPKAVKKNRYDIQAAWYTLALYKILEEDYPGFTILPFKFIVESTTKPGTPLVFTCIKTLLDMGRFGRDSFVLEQPNPRLIIPGCIVIPEIMGYTQLVDDYKWYLENGFEKSRRIMEAQGEFNIDWEGII